MKYFLLRLFLSCFFCLSISFAQTNSKSQKNPVLYSDAEKLMLFDIYKKDHATAILLSLSFSGAGHIYTGNWDKAVGFLTLKGTLIGLTLYSYKKTENAETLYLGYSITLFVYLLELLDVSDDVTKYNENLFSKLTGKPISLSLGEMNNGVSIKLAYAF